MFEKIGRAAEKAAASVPRRQFLGRLARGAALLGGTLGAILLTAGTAEAGAQSRAASPATLRRHRGRRGIEGVMNPAPSPAG